MSRCASALGAGGLSLLLTSWAGELKMLAPFLLGLWTMRKKTYTTVSKICQYLAYVFTTTAVAIYIGAWVINYVVAYHETQSLIQAWFRVAEIYDPWKISNFIVSLILILPAGLFYFLHKYFFEKAYTSGSVDWKEFAKDVKQALKDESDTDCMKKENESNVGKKADKGIGRLYPLIIIGLLIFVLGGSTIKHLANRSPNTEQIAESPNSNELDIDIQKALEQSYWESFTLLGSKYGIDKNKAHDIIKEYVSLTGFGAMDFSLFEMMRDGMEDVDSDEKMDILFSEFKDESERVAPDIVIAQLSQKYDLDEKVISSIIIDYKNIK